MKRTIRRIILVAVLATAGSSAQATFSACGIGTVDYIMIGGWGWQGLHFTMNYEPGTEPVASSFFNNNKIRILKSSFNDPDDFKTIKAAILLAYANGNRIRTQTATTNTAGTPDCTNVTEIMLLPDL